MFVFTTLATLLYILALPGVVECIDYLSHISRHNHQRRSLSPTPDSTRDLSKRGLSLGFPYGQTKVRGVNLGGWLVLEPWITPSLFDNTNDARIVDEYTFSQYQTSDKAKAVLKQHWDTWITESDFAAIAAAGLNHVRIPIGFWAFDVSGGEFYTQGQLPYLQKAVAWAAKYKIKVLIDLHGVPGSQNGYDNSGRRGSASWHNDPNNIKRSINVIRTIISMFKDQTQTVPMIAPLNEPAGYLGSNLLDATRQFWYDSWGTIRYPYGSSKQGNTVVMLHDAFQPLSYWQNFMKPSDGYHGVAMDTHIYQMFNNEQISYSQAQHIASACSHANDLSSFHLWVVVGEWTTSMNDCAKYLNGRGVGARYDGSFPSSKRLGSCSGLTGSASNFSADYKKFLRQMWEAQVMTFEKGSGWIQWTWKAEQADEWSYQAGLKNGWIPQNPTNFIYPNICKSS